MQGTCSRSAERSYTVDFRLLDFTQLHQRHVTLCLSGEINVINFAFIEGT